MEWKDTIALYAAAVSTVVAWRQFAVSRPRVDVWPGPYEGQHGRTAFDVDIHNDAEGPLLVSDWWVYRKHADKVQIILAGSLGLTLKSAANVIAGERQRWLVPPKSSIKCRISVSESAPRVLAIFGWERPSWLLPTRLPIIVHVPRRRMDDMHNSFQDGEND